MDAADLLLVPFRQGLVEGASGHPADAALQQGDVGQELGDGCRRAIDHGAESADEHSRQDNAADGGDELLHQGGQHVEFGFM